MNTVTLTGRLTADPELRTTEKGPVASLRLAIQRPRKEGEDQGADYVDITVFGRQGETCAQYLAKGRKVAIEGRLHHSEWDSDNGRRQKLEVVARNVEFLDPRKTNDTDDGPADRGRGRNPHRLLGQQKVWRDARANERPANRPHPQTQRSNP